MLIVNKTCDKLKYKRYALTNVDIFYVSIMCMKSYPCKHVCYLNDEKMIKSGNYIYKLLLKNELVEEHFNKYSNM
jgi:hypothetical protein